MMMVPASSTVSLISLCGRTIVPLRNTSSCAANAPGEVECHTFQSNVFLRMHSTPRP